MGVCQRGRSRKDCAEKVCKPPGWLTSAMVLSLALLLVMAGPRTAQADPKIALVIGNSAYQQAAPLTNADNDGRAMAAKLRELGFEVIEGIDLTHDQMVSKIRQLARRLPGIKTAVFFYAGHGMQVAGENFLVPVDANLEQEADLAFETIKVQTILDIMEAERRTNIVFLDACRDNPMAQSLSRSLSKSRSTAYGKGLAQLNAGLGTLITYSTQPNNVALDGDPAATNSPFTAALLSHIGAPGLEIRQAITRVRQDVVAETNGRQVPWDHSSLLGDFYFGPEETVELAALTDKAESAAPAPAATPAPANTGFEVEYWKTIQRIEKPDHKASALKSYLKRYPNGSFTDLARMELGAITDRSISRQEPAVPLEPLDEIMVLARNANIRSGPSTDHPKVATLRAGNEVVVVGRVTEANWYKLTHPRHGEAFVFGELLMSQEDWAVQQAAKANDRSQVATAAPTATSGNGQGRSTGSSGMVRVRNLAGSPIDPGVVEMISEGLHSRIGTSGMAKLQSATIDIVSARVEKSANPEYQGAQIAKSLFGGLIPNIGISEFNLSYKAEVRVKLVAKDGRQWQDSSKRERLDDSDQVNGGIFVQTLLEAAEDAGERASLRMVGGAPPVVVKEAGAAPSGNSSNGIAGKVTNK